MLVLNRRRGESLVIDGCIHVTVVAVRGAKVRLGIVAPREVTVRRSEVLCLATTAPAVGTSSGDALPAPA